MTSRDIKKSRDALLEILSGIAEHATAQAAERCPYRDRHDVCTAKFRCRNQRPSDDDPAVELCGHDGPFDYRSAWESEPRLYEKARADIARIKAPGRRRGGRAGRMRRERQSELPPDAALFDRADRDGVKLASSCKRLGDCHECIVEVTSGMAALSPPTPDEAFLRGDFRLACQARIVDPDAEITFKPLHRRARILTTTQSREVPLKPAVTRHGDRVHHDGVPIGAFRGRILGLAIDLGTTTIVMELLDLQTGEILGACSLENPQRFAGSDVLNRISYDRDAPSGELQKAVVSAINREMIRLYRRLGLSAGAIYEVVVAGNSTMRDVLFGLDVQSLGQKPYRSSIEAEFRAGARETTALTAKARALGLRSHGQGRAYGLPLVGSHVGADTAAALAALDVSPDADAVTMVIDIGTNTEVVIAGRGQMLAASCPAGPAFEGGLVTHGMPGHDGAIESLRITDDGTVDYATIGDKPPVGLCGSGLIDLIAELRRTGRISEKGVLKKGARNFQMTLVPEAGITFSAEDASHLAQAKAASYCGQALLMHQFGIRPDHIATVYLAGGFANYLNIDNAVAIGFLAPVQKDRIVKVGNAALQGAREMLLDATRRPAIDRLVRGIEHVELETAPEFFDLFVEGCQFKPMPADLGL